MPRLQLATRMVSEHVPHSGHGRSLTRKGNTLDRTITVAAGGTSARGGMFVLPVSPVGRDMQISSQLPMFFEKKTALDNLLTGNKCMTMYFMYEYLSLFNNMPRSTR